MQITRNTIETTVGPSEPDARRLAHLLSAHAPYDGRFELRMPGLHAIRASRTNTELMPTRDIARLRDQGVTADISR